jgi:ABC-2 type transport system permease protein
MMKAFFEIYYQQFKTSLAATLQYRASLAIWMIGHVLEPVVFLSVWLSVSNSSTGSVGGYTAGGFAAYFILLMLVNHVTFTWIMYEYEYRIRNGTLSFALLKPIHPIHSDIADNVASKLITMPFMLAIAGILALAFHPLISPSFWSWALVIPALLLALLIRFLFEWTLAQAAFWTTRVSAINQTYFVLLLFLSGQLAPLALYPGWIQIVAFILPFRWMISFPLELLLGQLTPTQALTGLVIQVAWVLAGYFLFRIVWRAGVRIYSAVGA